MNPLVSIITPSFNQGQFIEHTIKSVLKQTYKNIEYIVVDGGSSDSTMEIINKYEKDIDIIISEKDRGQTDAINKGFRLAKGELIGWINSDDILYSHCISDLVEAYNKRPDSAIYYSSDYDIIDKQGQLIRKEKRVINGRNELLKSYYEVVQPGSFYSASLVATVGFLDEEIHYCMDLDLWLKLLRHGDLYDFCQNRVPVAAYREWEETKTSTGLERFYRNIREVLLRNGAKHWDYSVIRTIKYELSCLIKKKLHLK